MESLEKAEELYKKATEMKSPEGFVKLGVVKIEKYNRTNNTICLNEAKECFISSISYGSNQFSAAGFFMLGNLLKQQPNIFNENEIRIAVFSNRNRFPNLIIECYVRSYEIFLSLAEKNKIICNENKKIFELLSSSFQDLKINPLDLFSGY